MSLSTAVLRELMAAGLSGDALLDACARIERDAPCGDTLTKRQARNRRYYVSKRLKSSYSDDQDANSDAALPPKKETSPTPPKEKTTPLSSEPTALRCDSAGEAFSRFWEAYPRRSGGNSRKNAESRFRSAVKAGVSPSDIIDGVQRYAAHCQASGIAGSSFVKMADAWLNGRFWESDWSVAQPRAGPGRVSNNTRAIDALNQHLDEMRNVPAQPFLRLA